MTRLFAAIMRRRILVFLLSLPLTVCADARQWLAVQPEIPDVMLIDSDGVEHHLPTLITAQPVAISFFYTRCSTVCPLQTALFQRTQQRLSQRHDPGLLLSISLDPVNDNPAAMRSYADKFKAKLGLSQRWLLLSGDSVALQQVWTAFGNNNGPPEAHASSVWVGSARQRHWASLSGFASADELADWMAVSAQ